MKRILCCIILLCILAPFLLMNAYAVSYKSAKEAIDDANDFIFQKMGYENYYLFKIGNMDINEKLAQYGSETFYNRPVFVYGDSVEASKRTTTGGRDIVKKVNGKDEYRALGYAVDGSVFPNPAFLYDNEGHAAKDKKWVKEPWNGKNIKYLYGEDGSIIKKTLSDSVLNYIKNWIQINGLTPTEVEAWTGKRNYFVENAVGVPEKLKNNFEDFLYIIQPPTEHAWGLGIAFYYWNGYNNLNYKSFLIKPFDMVADDLDVGFYTIPGSVTEGSKVLVAVKVKSHFDIDLENVSFKWNITTKDSDDKDIPLDAGKYELQFVDSADNNNQSGTINISAKYKEEFFYAQFKMPDRDVYIEFAINEDGKNPVESNMENNTVSTVVKAEKPINMAVKKYDLPYYALSREISYPLADQNIVVNLKKPGSGWWSGNAKVDAFNVDIDTKFLHNYQVGSPVLEDEEDDVIVSLPNVRAKIQRSDFGDDPENKKWLAGNNSTDILTAALKTFYDVFVLKEYKYETKCNRHEDCEAEGCSGYVKETGYARGSRSGTAPIEVNTYVYNGKKDLNKKQYENKIVNNYDKDFKARILWTNSPIKFNVIRYMCDLDVNGNAINWRAVPGKYEREFVQQCSADIDWNIARSMQQDYEQARKAAREGKQDKSFYNKAVFATDKNLQRYDYPIKSGYYFNPTGTYTFEITTVTYKNNQNDTEEHKKLVNALVNSFRYESNLIYVDDNGNPVNIANGSYKTLGVLTAAKNTGIGGKKLISVNRDYKKVTDEIYYDSKRTEDENKNGSHDFWKMSMEGYSLSGSLDSYNKYKYREYVAGGKVFKITETTKVTFIINEGNAKFYTHPKMPDGEYYITVRLSDIDLSKMSGMDYSSIKDVLKGVILDRIKVNVKGSIYGDIS